MKKLAIWFASLSIFALTASTVLAGELNWDFSFSSSDITLTPRGEYTVVSLADGSNPRDAIGAPAIPVRYANILLPDGATDVSVTATGDLVLLASDITPWPVQRVAPKSKPQPPFTAPDPAAYASASPWPAAVATFEGLHDMQGSTFVSVRVNPLVYVASEKALYYRPSVAVAVSYTPASSTAPRAARSVSQNALATEMVNALVVNPESATSPAAFRRRAAARAATVDYLIITSSTLSNAFQNLAAYRATPAGGSYKTLVVTTNTIASSYSGDDIQMKIRNCISNYVKSSGTTYVVLGGDDSVVPDRDCYGNVDNETYEWHMPTDLYYSDLTGTWKASGNTNFGVVKANVDMSPDVIVGRIPVRTAAQLSGYLAKVQAFEADTSHTRNSIIMGGPAAWCRYYANKRPSDNVTGDGHAAFRASNHTYVSDSEMWNRRLFRDGIYTNWSRVESSITMKIACDSITSWDSSTCGDKALSSSNLKNWLNNGYTHFMFSGHGYPQGWGMETSGNYSTSQASSQTNLVAFVYTDACLTGAFDEDGVNSYGITVDIGTTDEYTYTSEPCLGEAFVRNASGGALVHMGCARYGWGTPDASSGTSAEDSDGYYTNYTATATSDGGPSTVYAYKFYKRLYESAAVASNRTLGAAFAMSKADMISECSSDGCERWIQYGLNYLGDPAIALYPRTAADIAPEFSSSTATTNAVKGETVYFDFSELLSAGYPDPTYTITSSVSSSLWSAADELLEFTPNATGSFTFTCTASNSEGTATCVLTVTVTLPQPDTPSTPSVVGSDSFTATWTAVSGASRYELVVIEGASGGGSGGGSGPFTLVSSASGLTAGEYVILAENADRAMNNTCSGSTSGYLGYEEPTVSGSTISTDDASIIWTLAGSASSCTLYNADAGKYANPTTTKATVGWSDSASGAWTLSMSGDVVTAANASSTDFVLQYNNTSPRFACYSSAQKKLRFFRRDAARALPRAAGDVVYSNSVGNVTNFVVTGLQPNTSYSYSYRAIVNGEATPWSEPAAVTTAEGDVAPSWSAFPAEYSSCLVGAEMNFYATNYVSGTPFPTVTLSSTTATGGDYDYEDGYLYFKPTSAGTYTFTFAAANSEGSANATLTVEVSAAPVTVPTLLVGDETATTAYATWSECTGVSSYTLQLASDNQFTTGGAGGSVTLFSNDGTDATSAPSGWTYNVSDKASVYLLMFSGHSVVSEAVDASACTDLSVSLDIRTYGGTSQPNLAIQYSTDNGSTWTDAGTVAGASSTMAQRTLALPAAAASSALRLRFAPTTTSSSVGVGIKAIVLTGTQSAGGGSLISSTTVNDTEYTFTGLSPYTVYYARVKGNADWSNTAEFTTESAGDTAPAWSATFPSTVSTNVGDFYTLANVSSYVSGSPAPSISLTAPAGLQASLEDDTFLFGPEASGSYTFIFTASNSVGTATATLVVTAVGQAPELTASLGTAVAVTVSEPVSFTVTATGIPAPSVTMADTEYAATFENGGFSFTPAAVGTYAFTFNASNSEGTDTLTVTVTASAAPVTVPELTVTDVTDTTALATWTACDGVSSYTLQLTDDAFPAASSAARSLTTLLHETFDSVTGTSIINDFTQMDNTGWEGSYVYAFNGAVRLSSGSGSGDLVSPWLTNATAGASVRVVFDSVYWTNDLSSVVVDITEDDDTYTGATTNELTAAMVAYTNTFAVTGTRFRVRWTPSANKKRFFLDNITITTPTSGGGDTPADDSVQEFTVTGTSHTFTNLTPDTAYAARVKGNAAWSEEFIFETLASAGTAPSIEAIADRTMSLGDIEDEFTVSATGTPAPTFSVTSSDAPVGSFTIGENSGEFSFMPETVGTFHFTVTAANGVSPDATATFAVTVTGTAPALAAIADRTISLEDGGDEFTVTATGTPAPTFSVTSSDAPAGDYSIGENDGVFTFLAYSAGTYHFTITADNGVSPSASQSFTITVTATPEPPASDFEQWLADHGASGHTADETAPNGHTYGQNYAADIDPTSADFLDLVVSDASTGQFTILNSSANRYYQLLYTTDLTLPLESYETLDLGQGATSGTCPATDAWYGGLRVTPTAP